MRRAKSDTELSRSDTELSRRKKKESQERQTNRKRHFQYQMYQVREEAVKMKFSVQSIPTIPFTIWRKGKLTIAIKEERSTSYHILTTIPLRSASCNVEKSWIFQETREVDLELHLEYTDNKRHVHRANQQITIYGERKTVTFDMITEPTKNQNYQIPKWSFVLFDLNGNTKQVRSEKLSPVPKKNAKVYFVTDTQLLLVEVLEIAETKKELEEFKKKWEETDQAKMISERKKYDDVKSSFLEENLTEETTKLPTSEKDKLGIEQSKQAKFEIIVKKEYADVRYKQKPQLCNDEIKFVKSRRKKVFEGFRQLPVNIKENKVPNIAIIGSGGGMRAVIGMGAALEQLQQERILDCAMYVAGLSGSAWYLLTLYAHGVKINPAAVNSHIQRKVKNKYRIYFRMARKVLTYYIKNLTYYHGEYFSFTNLFGEMIGDLLLDKNCLKKWSDVAVLLDQGCNPLPLVSAINVKVEKTMQNYNEWMEFSPYQVLLPIYGAAIDMTKFGDKFERSFCTNTYEERPIHFLQGMCGSAYAFARDYRPQGNEWYIPMIVDDKNDIKNSGIWSLFNKFDSSFVAKVPHFLHGVSDIAKKEVTDLLGADFVRFGGKDKITRMKKINTPIEQTGLWNKRVRKIKYVILCFAKGFVRVALTALNVNFGYNFRYKDISQGHEEALDSKMLLVDAGIAFNSPYPSVLHPARRIDIILSFDFSDRGGDSELPFEELKLAEQWARLRDVPFPEIYPTLNTMEENWKKGDQREVYVFKSPGAPTIVHFVMINKSFRLENDIISENFDEIQKTKTVLNDGILYDLVTKLDIPESEKTHFYESSTEHDRKTAVLEMIIKQRDSALKQLVPMLETARVEDLLEELNAFVPIENILQIMAKDSVISLDEKRRIIDGYAPYQQKEELLELMRKRSDISLKQLIQTLPKRYELSANSKSTDQSFEKLLQTLPTTKSGTLDRHFDEILEKIGMQEICSLMQDVVLSGDDKIEMTEVQMYFEKKKRIIQLLQKQQPVIQQHVQTLHQQALECVPLELLVSIEFEKKDIVVQTFDEILEKIGMQVILCGLKRDDVISEVDVKRIKMSYEHCRKKNTLLGILNKQGQIALQQLVKTLQRYKCEYEALKLIASPDFENIDTVREILDEMLKHLNLKNVLNDLESHMVISGYEKCRINQCRTNEDKKSALIKIIIKRRDHALECFILMSQEDNLKEIFKKILKQFGISKTVNALEERLLIPVADKSCIEEYSFDDQQKQNIPTSMISVEAWKQLLNTLPKNSISQILDEMFENGNIEQMLYDLDRGTLVSIFDSHDIIYECETQLEKKNALLKCIIHTRDPNQFLKKLKDKDGAPNNFNILPDYGTLRFGYSEEEFYKFNSLVRHNVKNNMNEIIKSIKQKIVE